MAIIESNKKGVVLAARFDKTKPSFRAELKEFEDKLSGLQKKLGFTEFAHMTKSKGDVLEVEVIPVKKKDAKKTAPMLTPRNPGDWMKSIGSRAAR